MEFINLLLTFNITIVLQEVLHIVIILGINEIKKSPEFFDFVLDWSSCQQDLVLKFEILVPKIYSKLGRVVFESMRL
jgi:hypothetical protein